MKTLEVDEILRILEKCGWQAWLCDTPVPVYESVHAGDPAISTCPDPTKYSVWLSVAKIAVGQVVQVDYDSFVREFTDKTGATRYENRLTGRDLQIFSDRAF